MRIDTVLNSQPSLVWGQLVDQLLDNMLERERDSSVGEACGALSVVDQSEPNI